MHHGAHGIHRLRLDVQGLHQLLVACRNAHAVHPGGDAVAALFLNLRHPARFQRLVISLENAAGNGVRGRAFGIGRVFQQRFRGNRHIVDFADGKYALCQRPGFVKHHAGGLGQGFQIIAALD